MRNGNRGSRVARGDNGSLWISYSDLMSSLLLMFVLIIFYSVYQYFDMLETKSAELEAQTQELAVKSAELEERDASLQAAQIILAQRETELSQSQLELENAQDALALAQGELTAAQTQLSDKEKEYLIQQAALQLAQEQLKASEAELSSQKSAVAQSQQALASAEAELQRQQTVVEQQQAKLDAQQVQLDRLVGVRAQIIEQLIAELSGANITGAMVDDSGAIVFRSDMMFEKNKSTLQAQGKRFLDSFIPSYIRVLRKSENAQYVSQIIVEGHADIDGTYMDNMKLSQSRANAVVEYILSNEFTGISRPEKEWLRQMVTVNGRSSVEPVYNEYGLIDKDASRRVVIKFRLNDENMVESMLDVLENMN